MPRRCRMDGVGAGSIWASGSQCTRPAMPSTILRCMAPSRAVRLACGDAERNGASVQASFRGARPAAGRGPCRACDKASHVRKMPMWAARPRVTSTTYQHTKFFVNIIRSVPVRHHRSGLSPRERGSARGRGRRSRLLLTHAHTGRAGPGPRGRVTFSHARARSALDDATACRQSRSGARRSLTCTCGNVAARATHA